MSVAAFLTFRAGGDRFGVSIDRVREAARAHRIALLPGAPEGWAGVAVVRGEPLGVLDVARSMGVARKGPAGTRMLIILEGRPHALLVEHIDGVKGIAAERISPPPPGVPCLHGVVSGEEPVLQLLDLDALVSRSAR
jgi:chemotaxis signal transduction protein